MLLAKYKGYTSEELDNIIKQKSDRRKYAKIYYEENKEKIMNRYHKRREAGEFREIYANKKDDPEFKEKIRLKNKKYYERAKEKLKIAQEYKNNINLQINNEDHSPSSSSQVQNNCDLQGQSSDNDQT